VPKLSVEQTPEGWDRASTEYERVIVKLTLPHAERAIDRLGLRPGERIIDVACGPGTASFVAAERDASVMATDYAPDMIARLREAISSRGVSGIKAAVMDGQALEIPDGSFDAAICVFGLMFFPDQDAGFKELHRVLRPGGRAAVVTWSPPERNPGLTVQREAALAAVPDFPTPPGPPLVFSLSDSADLERRMREAGFENVSVVPSPDEWVFESPEDEWALLGASPVFDSVKAIAGDRLDAVHEELVRRVAERFGTGPVRIPAETLIAIGTKRR
jgi:SAM-dependent methyltransferase